MDGAFYPNIDIPKEFADYYLKRYGNDAQIAYAYNSYTFAKLTSVLFKNAHMDLTSDKIMDMYANPPNNLGFNFSDTKEGGRFYEFPLVVKKIHGNEIEVSF